MSIIILLNMYKKNEITIRPSNYIGIEKTIIDLIERFNNEE